MYIKICQQEREECNGDENYHTVRWIVSEVCRENSRLDECLIDAAYSYSKDIKCI